MQLAPTSVSAPTSADSGGWTAAPSPLPAAPQPNWFTRRRIAISLAGFTCLVVANVFWSELVPYNPLAIGQLPVASGLLLVLSGLALRSWAAGTLNKSRQLTTVGPFSLVRNPLYLGSFLMMVGFCILIRNWPAVVFVCGPLAVVYYQQIRFEEQRLAYLFPGQWPDYLRSVPRIVPRRLSRQMWAGWSLAEWRRNREYKALLATGCGLAGVLLLRWYEMAL